MCGGMESIVKSVLAGGYSARADRIGGGVGNQGNGCSSAGCDRWQIRRISPADKRRCWDPVEASECLAAHSQHVNGGLLPTLCSHARPSGTPNGPRLGHPRSLRMQLAAAPSILVIHLHAPSLSRKPAAPAIVKRGQFAAVRCRQKPNLAQIALLSSAEISSSGKPARRSN